MTLPVVLSEVLVAASGLVVGLSLYLMVHGYRTYRGLTGLAWAADRLGIAIRVGLLGVLIYGEPVPLTGLALLYTVGLTLSLAGSIALSWKRETP